MIKCIFIILLFFYLPQCSFNNTVSNLVFDNNKDNNETKLMFESNMSFEEFKKNVITYGEKSSYPKLD
jgi:hypothetical protein